MNSIGRWFMVIGVVLVACGAAMQFAPWLFNWFGRLPGDIRIDGERGKRNCRGRSIYPRGN